MLSRWCKQDRIWKNVNIADKTHMICFTKEDDSWKVILTNLVEIWMEALTYETMFHRCQQYESYSKKSKLRPISGMVESRHYFALNPLLNLEDFDWEQPIMDMLHNIPKYIIEASTCQIKLRKDEGFKLKGLKLKFSLELLKGTSQDFWENVTMPFCLSSMELLRQHEILMDLVKRKDEEIAEYKAEGAELIRKYIATKPFSEELFQADALTSVTFDFVKTSQSMLQFYNTINLPKVAVKQEFETPINNASVCDTAVERESLTARNMDDSTCTISSEVSHVDINPSIDGNALPNLNIEQSCLKNAENHSEANPSASKASILKLRTMSHTIQKSLKKSKKSLNDFIL